VVVLADENQIERVLSRDLVKVPISQSGDCLLLGESALLDICSCRTGERSVVARTRMNDFADGCLRLELE
jgi:hypothetical protein